MKKAIVIALCLIIGGGALFGVGYAAMNFRLEDINMLGESITDTYESEESVKEIEANLSLGDITVEHAEDGKITVEAVGYDNLSFDISVKDGILNIVERDQRPWWKKIFNIGLVLDVNVKLPADSYDRLNIDNDVGDVKVKGGLTFGSVHIESDTSKINMMASVSAKTEIFSDTGSIFIDSPILGDTRVGNDTGTISLKACEAGNLDLSTDTGSVYVKAGTAGDVKVEVDTGSVRIENTECRDVNVEGDTGSVIMSNVSASSLDVQTATGGIKVTESIFGGEARFKSSTGSVSFTCSDASSIHAETSTGGIYMSLLSEKSFDADSSTGSVSVPNNNSGAKCYLRSSTGSIKVEYAK